MEASTTFTMINCSAGASNALLKIGFVHDESSCMPQQHSHAFTPFPPLQSQVIAWGSCLARSLQRLSKDTLWCCAWACITLYLCKCFHCQVELCVIHALVSATAAWLPGI